MSEESTHKLIIFFVEESNFVFGIFLEGYFVNTVVVNHTAEVDGAIVGYLWVVFAVFPGLVTAFEIAHEWLLVPELQKLGSAVVLQSLEVGVDFDIRLHQAKQNLPSNLNALRIKENCSDDRLKNIPEYLEIILIELIKIKVHHIIIVQVINLRVILSHVLN